MGGRTVEIIRRKVGWPPTNVMEPIAACCFTLAAAYLVYLLLISGDAWMHPEIIGSASYVWWQPGHESLLAMMRKVFDWKAFDPNVNRVRPLNDVFEVIDAIARPYIVSAFGLQFSLNISTVATIVLAPAMLFGWLRRIVPSRSLALCLLALFISTTGFLSLTISLWHPAKKLNIVLLCACLYFAERLARDERGHNFRWLCVSLLASFFSDELGLANFVVILILYWRPLLASRERAIRFFSLPIAFVVIANWVLPVVYRKLGATGSWNAFADGKKFSVFEYLGTAEFHLSAAIQLARSILSTFAISTHTAATEAACLGIFCVLVAANIVALRPDSIRTLFDDKFALSAVALILSSGYATLLDWYPFPHEVSYLGSFNYYYHSSIVVLVIVCVSYGIARLPTLRWQSMAACVALIAAFMNFAMFRAVNVLVEIIHYYPYSRNSVISAMSSGVVADAFPAPSHEDEKFNSALKGVFGTRWKDNGYYLTHQMLLKTPLMNPATIGYFIYTFKPWNGRPAL